MTTKHYIRSLKGWLLRQFSENLSKNDKLIFLYMTEYEITRSLSPWKGTQSMSYLVLSSSSVKLIWQHLHIDFFFIFFWYLVYFKGVIRDWWSLSSLLQSSDKGLVMNSPTFLSFYFFMNATTFFFSKPSVRSSGVICIFKIITYSKRSNKQFRCCFFVPVTELTRHHKPLNFFLVIFSQLLAAPFSNIFDSKCNWDLYFEISGLIEIFLVIFKTFCYWFVFFFF